MSRWILIMVAATAVAACDRAPVAPLPPVEPPPPARAEPPRATAETCDEEALSRVAAVRGFLVNAEMIYPMGEAGYPDAARLGRALADDAPEAIRSRALAAFDAVARDGTGDAVARPLSFVGVQVAMGTQSLRCFTTEALREIPQPRAAGVFDDLSRPELLRPGQSFYVGRHHGAPVTLFWDDERPTFLPALSPATE